MHGIFGDHYFEHIQPEFVVNSSESVNGETGANISLKNGGNNLVVDTTIGNGTTQLFFALELVAGCDGGPGFIGPACTTNLDFLDPLSITGASASDSNGNLVSGATFVSDSGFNPNASVSTPEPSSMLLLGAGLLGLFGLFKLKLFTA